MSETSSNQLNWGLVGHEWAVRLLKGQIYSGSVRHAYLITGPEGIGKRTLAIRFTQALNCKNPTVQNEPCGICSTCRKIEKLEHPDLFILKREEDKTQITIDQVRNLEHSLVLSPYEATWRIALMLDAQDANREAQNALLKTLEEAPRKAILILTAESPEALLPTITSRCEILRLRTMATGELEEWLKKAKSIPHDEAKILAHLTGGCVGKAFAILDNPSLLDQQKAWVEDALKLIDSSCAERFAYAENITRERIKDKLQEIFHVWLTLWRDITLCGNGLHEEITNIEYASAISGLSERLDKLEVLRAARELDGIQEKLDANVNPRLLTEVILMEWPY